LPELRSQHRGFPDAWQGGIPVKKILGAAGGLCYYPIVSNIKYPIPIKIMKSFTKVCVIVLASLTLAVTSGHAQADATATSTNTAPPAVKKAKSKRFSGKVASVDNDSKTVTLAGATAKTVKITSKTKIYNEGQPGTLSDVTVGAHVYGQEHEDADGNMVASTLRIGEPKRRTPPPSATTPASPDTTNPASPNPPAPAAPNSK
jgi:Cu/Ag efflux protein CusF